MTKLGFIGVTLSSPDHWLVDNANQCTYLVGYLVSNGCNALARLVTDTTELSNDQVCSQSDTACRIH